MLAKAVNDNAGILDERFGWAFFASELAPTGFRARKTCGVGASLLAKVVNDNAGILDERFAFRFFASKLAPTKIYEYHYHRVLPFCHNSYALPA